MERQVLELRDLARMLSRHKLVVLVLVAAFLAGAVAYTLTTPKRYMASSRLLLLPVAPGSPLRYPGSAGAGGSLGLDMSPSTQAQVVDSPLIAARVARSLELDATPGELADMVDVQAGETQVLQVYATTEDPKLSAALANGFAQHYIAYRREFTATALGALVRDASVRLTQLRRQLQAVDDELAVLRARLSPSGGTAAGVPESPQARRLGALTTKREDLADQVTAVRQRASDLRSSAESVRSGAGQVIQRAVAPVAPTRPKPARDLPVGLLAGLLAALVSVFVLEYFDDRVRSRGDLEARTGTPVLAVVPKLGQLRRRARAHDLVLRDSESGASANAFRRLRARLLADGIASRGDALLVASLHDGDEAAMIVVRLAVALARANVRTLLVSLDVRHHRVETLLQARRDVGLTDVLLDHRPLASVATVTDQANLSLIPAGSGRAEDADLFASARLVHVLDEGGRFADVVLVEAPAGSTGGDLALLASQVDGSLLVARAGATRHRALGAALGELRTAGAPVLGVVLADKLRRRESGQHTPRPRVTHLPPTASEPEPPRPERASSRR